MATSLTEAEWLAATDPAPMLKFLRCKASERKRRLLAVACCRRLWPLLIDPASRAAVEVAERFADGEADEGERARAWAAADDVLPRGGHTREEYLAARAHPLGNTAEGWAARATAAAVSPAAAFAARLVAEGSAGGSDEKATRCQLVRCVFHYPDTRPGFDPAWRTWDCGKVRLLARLIYHERGFDRLPMLADALEDAGCSDAGMLGHLRSMGPHSRGCWPVDLVLGQE